MELQADAGDRAGAISTYHKCAEILEHELQVKPSQATETLAERLLSSDSLDVPRTPSPRHARTRLTQRARLVGREREFDQVLESWNNVVDGRPRLLVVTGDAGLGKSRLISELALQARTDGAVVATPVGGTHFAQVQFDRGIEAAVARDVGRPLGQHPRHAVIGHDELCACCNGGRLLPSIC